ADNYFWRVYFQGFYTPDCCPEYLKEANFGQLRAALPRLKIHTSTVTDFLRTAEPGLSKFVLLDHMDWMSCTNPAALQEEWDAIRHSAGRGARPIFRRAGVAVNSLHPLPVRQAGKPRDLGSVLRSHPGLAAELHARDRVHTYGSFHIADLP